MFGRPENPVGAVGGVPPTVGGGAANFLPDPPPQAALKMHAPISSPVATSRLV